MQIFIHTKIFSKKIEKMRLGRQKKSVRVNATYSITVKYRCDVRNFESQMQLILHLCSELILNVRSEFERHRKIACSVCYVHHSVHAFTLFNHELISIKTFIHGDGIQQIDIQSHLYLCGWKFHNFVRSLGGHFVLVKVIY